jgi:NTE family protein
MKKIGLTLGSGGARGVAFLPFLEILDEMKIKPSIISGCSIGALIGAFYAHGYSSKDMLEIGEGMGLKDLKPLKDISLFNKSSLVGGDGIEKFFKKYLTKENIGDLDIQLKVVATDLWHNQPKVFDSGNLINAVWASAALPGLLEPVVLEDRVYVDGGLTDPLPVDIIRDECDILIAINVLGNREPDGHELKPTLLENTFISFHIMESRIVDLTREKTKVDVAVQPDLRNIRVLEFHRYKEILKCARKATDDFRRKIEKALG